MRARTPEAWEKVAKVRDDLPIGIPIVEVVLRNGSRYFVKQRPLAVTSLLSQLDGLEWVETTSGWVRASEIVAAEGSFRHVAGIPQ